MLELLTFGILGLLIIALLIGHITYVRESNKEKAKLLNAVISKTPEQFRDLEMTSKIEPIKAEVPTIPDLVSVEDLTDEEFNRDVLGVKDGRS